MDYCQDCKTYLACKNCAAVYADEICTCKEMFTPTVCNCRGLERIQKYLCVFSSNRKIFMEGKVYMRKQSANYGDCIAIDVTGFSLVRNTQSIALLPTINITSISITNYVSKSVTRNFVVPVFDKTTIQENVDAIIKNIFSQVRELLDLAFETYGDPFPNERELLKFVTKPISNE